MRHNMGLETNPCNKGEISKLPKKIKTISQLCEITQVLYLVSVASDMSKLAQFLRYPAPRQWHPLQKLPLDTKLLHIIQRKAYQTEPNQTK